MNFKPIRTEKDYDKALSRMKKIFNSPMNSPEGDEAEVLALLIEDYEEKHYPIGPPDPIEAIKIRSEEKYGGF